MEKLKPCPFCGGEELVIEGEPIWDCGQFMGFNGELKCIPCGAMFQENGYESGSNREGSELELILRKRWNRRDGEQCDR